ncbi:hypothetical protein J2Z48_002635 [Croceifilum oryzae]|uniref:Uncharacterized protein n=1 Tax=Croceifilum oryzae TaxID=1553429 RepID=A0AAJ1TGI2_9BACL|nr:hypothetical protein [Croceifilum oryzae]
MSRKNIRIMYSIILTVALPLFVLGINSPYIHETFGKIIVVVSGVFSFSAVLKLFESDR